jgi:hypothetical protein
VRLDDADDFLLLDDLHLHEGATVDGGRGFDELIQRGRIIRGRLKEVDVEDFELQD